MYADMTAEDLLEWEAAYSVAQWGEDRAELLHGVLCNLIDACHRTKGTPEPPTTYMPFARSLRNAVQNEDQMRAVIDSVAASWNP